MQNESDLVHFVLGLVRPIRQESGRHMMESGRSCVDDENDDEDDNDDDARFDWAGRMAEPPCIFSFEPHLDSVAVHPKCI